MTRLQRGLSGLRRPLTGITMAVVAATAVVGPGAAPGAVAPGGSPRDAIAATAGRDAPDADLAVATRPRATTAPVSNAFDPTKVALGLSLVRSGFSKPVLVTNAGDGSGRLFVVEQTGLIRIIDHGTLLPTPFLDLRGKITTGGERGLLGLAFHPGYAVHHYIYVNFTDLRGNTVINRYAVGADPNVVIRGSAVRILTIAQPYSNHNGGNLAFGPDGYLYIGMGDGGSAGDPGGRAQSLNSLLGKMLRIDIDHRSGTKYYRVPSSNPYVGRTGLDEIWSRGLRNPWRWSFDFPTGQLWIGDVGQNRWEEIDRSLRTTTSPAGRAANYGWNVLEGNACYKPATGCSRTGKQPPLIAYGHSVSGTDNCSVTGGYVYRGSASPILTGAYLFGDFCSGRIWGVPLWAHTPATPTLLRDATASPHVMISSFGVDEAGEMYLCDLAGGAIYRITATAKA